MKVLPALALIIAVAAAIGYVILFFNGAQPASLFWGTNIASAVALVAGISARADRIGRAGMWIGAVDVLIGVAMIGWLTF